MTGNISYFSSHVELYQAPAYRLVQNLLATKKGPDLWTEEGEGSHRNFTHPNVRKPVTVQKMISGSWSKSILLESG
jgi:hypothetical protein